MRFDSKTVIITGGASGIGAAMADRLYAEGASLVAADLNDELGQSLVKELGGDLKKRGPSIITPT